LHFAKGVVPTPPGDVTISWSQNDSDFTLDFTVPTDTEVTLPETNGTMGQLTVDGKFSGNPYHAGMQLTLPRGEHHITISAKKVWLRR
jgi:hypothetical protein